MYLVYLKKFQTPPHEDKKCIVDNVNMKVTFSGFVRAIPPANLIAGTRNQLLIKELSRKDAQPLIDAELVDFVGFVYTPERKA